MQDREGRSRRENGKTRERQQMVRNESRRWILVEGAGWFALFALSGSGLELAGIA
jgi:hypothetical protein